MTVHSPRPICESCASAIATRVSRFRPAIRVWASGRDNTVVTVYSYGIPVLAVRMTMQPAYKRLWDGWSVSTMNHVRKMAGVSFRKAEWLNMPVGEWVESDKQATVWRA